MTKVFEDRLDAPTEADLFKLPTPGEGEIYSMAVHPSYLKDFLDHPFTVKRETQDYKDLFESIKNYGIREPVLCRPGRNGGLEIISGHRRHDIGAQLNYPIPVLIERVDEDDAQIQCVDGNLHRKDIPLSELARAAQMKMDALKRKAGRRSKADILAGKEPMKRSDEQVGEDLGMSRASVQRLMRVNQLEEPLKKMVDKKELPLDTAEQISHMKPAEQKTLADAIEKEGGKVPSKTEAVKLKEESRAGTLTPQKIEKSVAPTKREIDPPLKVTFQDDELRPYFPEKGTTVATVKRTMFEAMDLRKRALERQKAKTQAENDGKKRSEPAPDGSTAATLQWVQRVGFRTVTVFDVSQTEGKPLPELVHKLTGGVVDYERITGAISHLSPYPISIEAFPGAAFGCCNFAERRILVQPDMSQVQTIKTMIHEVSHAKLHAPKEGAAPEENRSEQRSSREVEAESVAYVVCQHFGIDTSDYSFGYVAGWSRGKDLTQLRASLERIRDTAAELIDSIDPPKELSQPVQEKPAQKRRNARGKRNQPDRLSR